MFDIHTNVKHPCRRNSSADLGITNVCGLLLRCSYFLPRMRWSGLLSTGNRTLSIRKVDRWSSEVKCSRGVADNPRERSHISGEYQKQPLSNSRIINSCIKAKRMRKRRTCRNQQRGERDASCRERSSSLRLFLGERDDKYRRIPSGTALLHNSEGRNVGARLRRYYLRGDIQNTGSVSVTGK